MVQGQSTLLLSLLGIALTLALALLLYTFLSSQLTLIETGSSSESERIVILPPDVLRARVEINRTSGEAKLCVLVRNRTDENVSTTTIQLIVSGQPMVPYSPDCNDTLPSRKVCTLCVEVSPYLEARSVIVVFPNTPAPTQAPIEVPERLPDPAILSMDVANTLSFAPPSPDRYAGALFHGDENKALFRVEVANLGQERATFELTLSGPCIENTSKTLTLAPSEYVSVDMETNTTTASDACLIVAEINYPLDQINTANDHIEKNFTVYFLDYCNGCSDEAESCETVLKRHANTTVPTIVLLTRDDNVLNDDCVVVSYYTAYYNFSKVVFDGNGHILTSVGQASLLGNIPARCAVFRQTSGLHIRNIELNGDGTGLSLTNVNKARLTDVLVNSQDSTYLSVDPPIYSATNSYCGDGRQIIAINPSNASEYNNVPLDANDYCHISVSDVSDLVLDFNGTETNVRAPFIWAQNVPRLHVKNLRASVTQGRAIHIYMLGEVPAFLENIVVRTTGTYAHGIYLYMADGSILSDVNITTTDANAYGIYLYNSDNVNLQDVNITTLGPDATPLHLYLSGRIGFVRVRLNAVDPSAPHLSLSLSDSHSFIYSATNSYCGDGRQIIAINPSNASEYNNVPLDANDYCHISVSDVSDLVLDFNGTETNVRAPFVRAQDAQHLSLKNLGVITTSSKSPALFLCESNFSSLADINATTSGVDAPAVYLRNSYFLDVRKVRAHSVGSGAYALYLRKSDINLSEANICASQSYAAWLYNAAIIVDLNDANTWICSDYTYIWYSSGGELNCINCGNGYYLVTDLTSVGGSLATNCECNVSACP